MNKNILTIILGNNINNLFGCCNDAILMYNFFYSFYLQNKIWLKPYILLNHNITTNNIKQIIKENSDIEKILIFFSGHGYYNKIQFGKKIINKFDFYNLINDSILYEIELILILDACYSGSFIANKKYSKIIKILFISSCNSKQQSNEGLSNFNSKYYKYKKPLKNEIYKTNNSYNLIIGIFTFNFYKLIINNKLFQIEKWKNINNYKIWNNINNICNQTIQIKIIFSHSL